MILLLEPHTSAPAYPSPHGRVTAPALWRLTCLAAKALLAAIMPVSMPQHNALASLKRHLLEPPRKRSYQAIPVLS